MSNEAKMKEFYRICQVSFNGLKLCVNTLISHIIEKYRSNHTFNLFK